MNREIIETCIQHVLQQKSLLTVDNGTGAMDRISASSGRYTVHHTTTSTMDDVDHLIAEGHPDGTTVIALIQDKGRGSDDPDTGKIRKWWSGADGKPTGNLFMSRVTDMEPGEYANEIEFIAALAVAEIIADLLPRATVSLKYPNDVLVDDAKICGCLTTPKYEDGFRHDSHRQINLGIGVNLGTTPPISVIREKAAVTAVTCLKDHGVTIGIGEFAAQLEEQFEAIRQEYRLRGFTYVLQRIGFADPVAGNITLWPHQSTGAISGTYRGFNVEQKSPGINIESLSLQLPDGSVAALPLKSYSAKAIIKGASALGQPASPPSFAKPHA